MVSLFTITVLCGRASRIKRGEETERDREKGEEAEIHLPAKQVINCNAQILCVYMYVCIMKAQLAGKYNESSRSASFSAKVPIGRSGHQPLKPLKV